MSKGVWKPSLAALITGIAILLMVKVLDSSETKRFQEQERADILNQLSTVRSRLEASINSTLLVIDGLVAYASTNPNLTDAEFVEIAKVMKAKHPKIRSINLARGVVIRHVYPLKGNEAALGLDYAATPEQYEAVKQAIKTRTQVVAGPVNLVQGGMAFINRSVIFVTPPGGESESGNFWGLAIIVVDVDLVYEEAGLLDRSTELNYALRGKDGLGASGEVFFGNAQIFEQEPVFLAVTLPNGSWQLAAIPYAGWSSSSSLSLWIWTAGGVTAVLASSLVFILVSAPERLQIAVDKATAALQQAKQKLAHANEKLAQANETLEDKVQERTAELATANEQITALNEQLKAENLRMGAELDVARQIQQMVLPVV